jgi:hypothetical protein
LQPAQALEPHSSPSRSAATHRWLARRGSAINWASDRGCGGSGREVGDELNGELEAADDQEEYEPREVGGEQHEDARDDPAEAMASRQYDR